MAPVCHRMVIRRLSDPPEGTVFGRARSITRPFGTTPFLSLALARNLQVFVELAHGEPTSNFM
jgi:hypothetical protein